MNDSPPAQPPTNPEIIGVIFDMDGVLTDSGQLHQESWKVLADEYGVRIEGEFFKRTFGQTNQAILRQLLGEDRMTAQQMTAFADHKEGLFRKLAKGRLPMVDGAFAFVEALSRDGSFKLAVGSSGPRENIDFALQETRLEPFFHATVSGQEVAHSKPAPDTFLAAAAAIGVPPHRCVVVEDAVVGIEAAKAGGMRAIALTTTHGASAFAQAAPDLIVGSPAELTPGIIRSLMRGKP